MSQALLEIFKKNSLELEELKKEVKDIKIKIEKLENEATVYSGEIKEIGEKSYYIEKYLENIQNTEIEDILKDENLIENDSDTN